MRTYPLQLEDFIQATGGRFVQIEDEEDTLDIAAIQQEAYERGQAEGRAAGRAEETENALRAASARLGELSRNLNERLAEQERLRLAYLEQVFKTLLPSIVSTAFPREAARMVEAIINDVASKGHTSTALLRIRTAEHHVAGLTEMIDRAGAHGVAAVFADPGMADGAVEVAWDKGGATLDLTRVADNILSALNNALDQNKEDPDHDE